MGAYIFFEGMVKLTGRKRIAVVVVLVGIAAGVSWFVMQGTHSRSGKEVGEGAVLDAGDAQPELAGRASWEAGENDVVVGVDVEREIPGFVGGAFSGASLIPLPEGTEDVVWEAVRENGGVLVSGTGQWRGNQVEVSWRFVAGDPQSRLQVVVRDVAVTELLGGDVVGMVAVGRPVQQFLDEKARLREGIGTAGEGVVWAQWSAGEEALTLSGIVADSAVLGGAGTELEVAFWRRGGLDEAVLGCEQVEAGRVTLVVQMDWTVGSGLPVAAARLPHGYRAALVPVFGDVSTLANREWRAGAARSVEDWLGRARTLIYGHSSPEDPRYGNGGLLGTHFGGSVVVPGAWWGESEVQALAAELAGTRVELVPDGMAAPDELGEGAVYVAGDALCEQVARAAASGASLLLVPGAPDVVAPEIGRAGNVRGKDAGRVQVMGAVGLDGRRAPLVEGVFAQEALESLLREREISVISTPLVATRNPLIELWHEALLQPERGGEWTLQEDVSRAFARGELFRETEKFLVTSASALQKYWRERAQVDVWQGPDGELVIYHGGEQAVAGFTVVIAGQVRRVGEDAAQGIELVVKENETFLWLDLEPGARREVFLESVVPGADVGFEDESRLHGVRWQ